MIIAGKDENGDYYHVDGFQRADKEVWTSGDLNAGEYWVYIKVNWRDQQKNNWSLGIYGPQEVEVNELKKVDCREFIHEAYLSLGRQLKKLVDYDYYGVKECYRGFELTDDGIGYIYYKNNSNQTLNETSKLVL